MAIKASAQITLHYVIDIQGIYRYYLLQGSTLAKPSKPAKYPPVTGPNPKFTNIKDDCIFKYGYRYSLSGGGWTAVSNVTTIVMPVPTGITSLTFRFKNITPCTWSYLYGGTDPNALTETVYSGFRYDMVSPDENGVYSVTGTKTANCCYVCVHLEGSSAADFADTIITINEPIEWETLDSTWSDTEPTYQNGATNSLYFVDCTVFSDGTFEYSEVSLSTAYEAAKEAWNKAQNAQDSANNANDKIDNLEIGGRNLLKFTETLPIDYNLIEGIGSWSWQGLSKTDDGLKLSVGETVDSNSFQVPLVYKGAIEGSDDITLSFKYRGDFTKFGNFYFAYPDGSTSCIVTDWILEPSETEWKYFEKTFSTDIADNAECSSIVFCYGHVLSGGTGTWLEIKNKSLQLEKGNKATDWTPASEDINDAIIDKGDELTKAITDAKTDVIVETEQILLEALTEYTISGDFEAFKQTTESRLQLLSNELNIMFTETNSKLDDVNASLQEQLNTVTKYFTFDINGLTIGQSDNPYKVIIDNDRYSMTANDVEVMWIANGEVNAPSITITQKFTLFNYVITRDDNGRTNVDFIRG